MQNRLNCFVLSVKSPLQITEIISSVKSKNFEGYNIDAIINNRMASWLNKTNLQVGACVVVKAKVKDHSKHWKHGNDVTRLNYVKAAQ